MKSRLYSLWLAVVAVIAACALGILGLPAAAFAQSPALSLDPTSGPSGTQVTVTGEGWAGPDWASGVRIDLSKVLNPGAEEPLADGIASPKPDGNGSFKDVKVSIPSTVSSGTVLNFSVLAAGGGHSAANAWFTVTGGQSSGAAPHITGYTTYTQGVMVILSVTYTGTADGFGFKGINGSGWAEENHPLSSPSYGHVSPGKIEYPFNHACGTSNAYQSDVAFWVYTGAARNETTAHLACSGQSTDNDGATTGNGTASNGGVFVCLGGSNCNGIPNPGSTANAKPYTWDNYLTYLEQFYGGAADANLSLKCTEGASTGSLDDLVAGCLSLLWKDAPPIVRTIFSTVFDGLKLSLIPISEPTR